MTGILRKLPFCGKNSGRAYFEFPYGLDDIIEQGGHYEQTVDCVLHKITCGVHDAISSIKFEFSDGVISPTFGKNRDQQLNCCLEVPEDETITSIHVRHKSATASIQNLTFKTQEGTEIEFNAKLADGAHSTFKLDKGEKIIGVYGYCWSEKEPELVGIGFVVWTPTT